MYNTTTRTGIRELINLSYDLTKHPNRYRHYPVKEITRATARSLSRAKKVQILTKEEESIEPFVDILLDKFNKLNINKTANNIPEAIELLTHIGLVKGL